MFNFYVCILENGPLNQCYLRRILNDFVFIRFFFNKKSDRNFFRPLTGYFVSFFISFPPDKD